MPAPNFLSWLNQQPSKTPTYPAPLADLIDLTRSDFPVPPGFIVLPDSFDYFLHATGLDLKIAQHLHGASPEHSDDLKERSQKIRQLITQTPIPKGVAIALVSAYNHLSAHLPILVRPYLPLPVGITTNSTITSGDANLLDTIKSTWSKLFTPAALTYTLIHHHQTQSLTPFCLVLNYPDIKASGLVFTTSSQPTAKQHLVIKAVWGISHLNSLPVIPDTYIVHKSSLTIVSKEIVPSESMDTYQTSHHQVQTVSVPSQLHTRPKLTDDQIITLTHIGKNLQQLLFYPQVAHWYLSQNRLFITATADQASYRPPATKPDISHQLNQALILSGQGSFAGITSGIAQVVTDIHHLSKLKSWHLLVTSLPLNTLTAHPLRCLGVITTCSPTTADLLHYASQLSKPLVTNCPQATTKLKSGHVYTINGATGEIFPGSLPTTTIKHFN